LRNEGCSVAPLIRPSSSIYNKKINFKPKTSETLFYLKSIFISKRGGQMEDEGRIFSISLEEY
jgi:hypothetical protein